MENETIELQTVPVLPLRGLVIFPGSILHFDVARKKSVAALDAAMKNFNQSIFITTQKDSAENDVNTEHFYQTGVFARILQTAKISDDVIRVIIRGMYRAEAESFVEGKIFVSAKVSKCEITPAPVNAETDARMSIIKEMFGEIAIINSHIPQDIYLTVYEMTEPGKLADYIADNILRDYHKKQTILETYNEMERLDKIIKMLSYESEILMIEEKITEKTKLGMDENQKEYYLRERIKAIKEELGDNEDTEAEGFDYRNKILDLKTTDENKEIRKNVVQFSGSQRGAQLPRHLY